jgi:hypothetical protein
MISALDAHERRIDAGLEQRRVERLALPDGHKTIEDAVLDVQRRRARHDVGATAKPARRNFSIKSSFR